MILHLSPREVQVCILAGCVVDPMSAKAIATDLGISKRTVEKHMISGAVRIRATYPHLDRLSPRRVCQAWLRLSYQLVPRVVAEKARRAA